MTVAVILAGGLGSRLSEETTLKPKPMVEIGGMPILWHIMKTYFSQGVDEFIICLGYKGYVIKQFFKDYELYNSDVSFDFRDGLMSTLTNKAEDWKVTLVDTGETTMTGGRLKRVLPLVRERPYFYVTYGDGLANVDLDAERAFHLNHGRICTMTIVMPEARFGSVSFNSDFTVSKFQEKPEGDNVYVNGGFFIMNPEIESYLTDDDTIFERQPLTKLCEQKQLMAFKHSGFWQPMDTLRDKIMLNNLWVDGKADWKIW